jgi:hypothetical protein
MSNSKLKTTYYKNIVEEKVADSLYDYFSKNIDWEEGVKSKKGFTRLAKSISLEEYPELAKIVYSILNRQKNKYIIFGLYLNYYANGEMWTPNHTHKGTHQLVISLGGTRTLTVGKKEFRMENGDAVIFGSSVHGVPKENNVEKGRISIATFMMPI